MGLPQKMLAHWLQHPWLARIVAVVCAAMLGWGATALAPVLLLKLQELSRDVVWSTTASQQPEHRVVLVDIDDASLQAIGAWPWSRDTIAQLTQQLDAAGVGLKLFDIVFPDAREGDAALSDALRAHDSTAPSVLAQVFALRDESSLRSGALAGALTGTGCQAPAVPAQGFVANSTGLHARAGHITPTIDADGAVRRMAALVCMDEKTYPALVLAGIASQGTGGAEPLTLHKGDAWHEPAWSIHLASLPGHRIGVDAQGQMRVPFGTARQALTRVSAADVLQGKLPPDMLQGAWVIIGASAFGLADVVPVALGSTINGAEVHMQLLLGMLDNQLPYTPMGVHGLQAIVVIPAVALLLWLVAPSHARQRVLLLPMTAMVMAAGMWALHAWAMLTLNWVVDWLAPALFTMLVGSALALGEHARLLVEKKRIYQNLASYVSDPVAQKIALSAPTDDIQAQRRDVTVLTADLKNFARYCEASRPEDTAAALHRFFTTAHTIVQAHGGMVEEMVGDSLVAVFNGEQTCAEHPDAALQAARQIWQQCTTELPNVQPLGLEALDIGLGLESGTALVGSFGPAGRRVHTVLGQTVTVALRLRAMTSDLAYPILLGPELAARLGAQPQTQHMLLKTLGSFLLPGLMQPSTVYTPRNLLQPGDACERRTLRHLQQQ